MVYSGGMLSSSDDQSSVEQLTAPSSVWLPFWFGSLCYSNAVTLIRGLIRSQPKRLFWFVHVSTMGARTVGKWPVVVFCAAPDLARSLNWTLIMSKLISTTWWWSSSTVLFNRHCSSAQGVCRYAWIWKQRLFTPLPFRRFSVGKTFRAKHAYRGPVLPDGL